MIVNKSDCIARADSDDRVVQDCAQIVLRPFLARSVKIVMQRHVEERRL
jgi:hypothetical protein